MAVFSSGKKPGVENLNFLLEAIKSIGPSNVLQVVTDNAANCKAAGEEVEKDRDALMTTIVLNSWRDWAKKGEENTRKNGETICETIRSDEFWDDFDHILAITKLVFLLIKFCDGEDAKMGEVFSESYKEGPSKKWDMNPESAYLEDSSSSMEDMQWENLD
ncbi:hypothetical protein CTI12_AA229590 [Artemisia annua]|uniref:DUF659 domain-containing protein n=1 Tax=Artemisia annua TaxID=35608 RepID=A0A2U1NTG4_ARTAN|nr:hypothetical protein CTI12_AA229590 [Artemisia annua]